MKTTRQRKNHRLLMPALASAVVAITLGWAVAAQAQAVHGSGTTNTIPVWTSSSTIGNSMMSQSSGNVNVSGGLAASGAVSAASLSGNGSGVTNVNAVTLVGLGPSAFAQLGASNTFTASQTINNNLTLTGSVNNALSLQGNLTDSIGDQGANVIGGFGGNGGVPGNSVASGVVGATVAGGGGFGALFGTSGPNTVTGDWGTVAGGFANTAGIGGAVGGGDHNTAIEDGATVAGGSKNTASFPNATVGGGFSNIASGEFATVPGGFFSTASGLASFAAGNLAQANNEGSFVWGDHSTTVPVSDTGANQFVARAAGGFTFYSSSDLTIGATLASGSGSWSTVSDRNVKANFSPVDGQALLARLAALPIATWNYKAQPDSIRHMGPTAQDFRAAFGLGEDERHISTVDAQGVALAAIQALYETVTELKRDLGDKDRQIVELRGRLAHLEQRQ